MFRTTRTKGVLAGTAAVLLAPIALAVPAQATVTQDGCTVTARTPYHAGFDMSGTSRIHREITITCDPGRSVFFTSELREQDFAGRPGDGNPDEDLVGSKNGNVTSFVTATGVTTETVIVKRVVPLPVPDETDDVGEFYQTVKFRVTASGVQGAWSTLDFSSVRSIQV